MIAAILKDIRALFLGPFNFRLLLYLCFICGIIVFGPLIFDRVTGYFFLNNMQKQVAVMSQLYALSEQGIATDPELAPVYHQMVSALMAHRAERPFLSIPSLAFDFSFSQVLAIVLRFLSAALLGILVAIAGLADRRKGDSKWSSVFFGGLLFALVVSVPVLFFPEFGWWFYAFYPLIQLVVILGAGKLTKRRQAA